MNIIFEQLNTLPEPYSDIASVLVLLIVLYVIALIISKVFAQKEVSPEPETETAEPVAEAITEELPPDTPPHMETDTQDSQEAFKPRAKEVIETTPVTEEADIPTQETEQELEPEEVTEPEAIEEVETEIEVPIPEPETPESIFTRLRKGLSKTQDGLFGKLNVILSRNEIDEGTWEEFEESLISSDIGVSTTMKLRERIQENLSKNELTSPSDIMTALKEEILNILKSAEGGETQLSSKPTVMMVAGVNGVGKTTTIGKLANRYINEGKKVMVAAADTFRAAAIEQLEVWSNRVGSDFIKGSPGADPSAVAFDAVQAAQARGIDLLIIDTAGRLHTKSNLMDELVKIKRVVGKEISDSPHEVLIVLDATTGQNAIQQAKTFNDAIDISGIVLTKLDGTAKGGVIIAIADELNIPVKYIGIGEGLDDLRNFDAEEFVEALFQSEGETIH